MNTSIPGTPAELRAAGDQVTGPGGGISAGPPATPDTPMVPFDPTKPNIARAYDYLLLRHEALRYRAGVRDLRRQAVAAA